MLPLREIEQTILAIVAPVKVIGHPEKGGDATNELKLTVQKK